MTTAQVQGLHGLHGLHDLLTFSNQVSLRRFGCISVDLRRCIMSTGDGGEGQKSLQFNGHRMSDRQADWPGCIHYCRRYRRERKKKPLKFVSIRTVSL